MPEKMHACQKYTEDIFTTKVKKHSIFHLILKTNLVATEKRVVSKNFVKL